MTERGNVVLLCLFACAERSLYGVPFYFGPLPFACAHCEETPFGCLHKPLASMALQKQRTLVRSRIGVMFCNMQKRSLSAEVAQDKAQPSDPKDASMTLRSRKCAAYTGPTSSRGEDAASWGRLRSGCLTCDSAGLWSLMLGDEGVQALQALQVWTPLATLS